MRLISDQTPLNEVFKIFKASYSHLMVAIRFLDPITNAPIPQVRLAERGLCAQPRRVYAGALAAVENGQSNCLAMGDAHPFVTLLLPAWSSVGVSRQSTLPASCLTSGRVVESSTLYFRAHELQGGVCKRVGAARPLAARRARGPRLPHLPRCAGR